MTLLKFVLTHALGSQTELLLMGEVEPIMQRRADCQQILGQYLLCVLSACPPPQTQPTHSFTSSGSPQSGFEKSHWRRWIKNISLTLHPNPLLLGKLSELIIKFNQHLNNCVCKMVLFYWPTLKSTQFYVFWLPGCVLINNIQLRNSTCECIMLTLKSVFLDLSHGINSHLFNFISNITCETPNSRVINVHIRWFLVVIVHLTCDISAMKLHVHK